MQNMQRMQNMQNKQKNPFLLLHEIFSSFSFSVLHLLNQNVIKSKVQCPHSISRTCLAQEFGLVLCIWRREGRGIFNIDYRLSFRGEEAERAVVEAWGGDGPCGKAEGAGGAFLFIMIFVILFRQILQKNTFVVHQQNIQIFTLNTQSIVLNQSVPSPKRTKFAECSCWNIEFWLLMASKSLRVTSVESWLSGEQKVGGGAETGFGSGSKENFGYCGIAVDLLTFVFRGAEVGGGGGEGESWQADVPHRCRPW